MSLWNIRFFYYSIISFENEDKINQLNNFNKVDLIVEKNAEEIFIVCKYYLNSPRVYPEELHYISYLLYYPYL